MSLRVGYLRGSAFLYVFHVRTWWCELMDHKGRSKAVETMSQGLQPYGILLIIFCCLPAEIREHASSGQTTFASLDELRGC